RRHPGGARARRRLPRRSARGAHPGPRALGGRADEALPLHRLCPGGRQRPCRSGPPRVLAAVRRLARLPGQELPRRPGHLGAPAYGLTAMGDRQPDAAVVGAGPAGCAAAFDLATAGLDVLLLDRRSFPRVKPCGGALTVKAIRALRFSIEPVVRAVITDLV